MPKHRPPPPPAVIRPPPEPEVVQASATDPGDPAMGLLVALLTAQQETNRLLRLSLRREHQSTAIDRAGRCVGTACQVCS